MTTITDHFDRHVEDAEYRDASPQEPHWNDGSDGLHDQGDPATDTGEIAAPVKPKRKGLPTPVLVIGGMVLFGVGMTVYKEMTAPARPNTAVVSANAGGSGMIGATRQPFAQPSAPLPAPQAAVPPQSQATTPSNAIPDPGFDAALPTQQVQASRESFNPSASSAAGTGGGLVSNSPNAAAFAGPASVSDVVTSQRAQPNTTRMNPTNATASAADATTGNDVAASRSDRQQAEIDVLKAQVQALRTQLDNAPHSSSDAGAADGLTSSTPPAHSTSAKLHKKKGTPAKHKRTANIGDTKTVVGASALSSLHIKQVIPGQGWVEDESTGKQQVVAVGDKIGSARVTKIDADNYKIVTTEGVIQ
ncbi:hypothetical protein AB4Y43_16620 [Paraburkholderia sp. BR10872]|uniref:hypothetical protein n=1 Tax=Paraburkholderia sp. BR10872 TaxID=3236989 RepID=UPI0034D1F569